ncbi:MAG TPA: response regulator, partial [Paludibacter sp.]
MKTKEIIIDILIAEDSPTQAEQLKYILETNNYRVIVAKDGKEALDLIQKDKPSIVISDIIMPKMNGYELCEKIKADISTKDIPVILLTSLSDSCDILKGLACGADNFLTKPYDERYLLSHITHVLANKNLHSGEIIKLGIEMVLGGKKRFITSTHQQMLSLLISTYEAAVQRNTELLEAQEELKSLNKHLETVVNDLVKEIAIRKNSEEFTKRIIASSSDSIQVLDLEGNLLSMNEGGQKSLKIDDLKPYLNKSWADFWKGKDNKAALKAIAEAKKGNSTIFAGFCPTEKKIPKWWEIIVSPIGDIQDKIYNLLVVSRDITERRQADIISLIQYNIAMAMTTCDTVEQLLSFARSELNLLFDTTNFFVALYKPESNTLKKLHWFDEKDAFEEWDAGKSLSGYVVKTAKTLLLNKHEIAKLAEEQNMPIMGSPAECWLGVPLIVGKKAIGVLVIQNYTNPEAYNVSFAKLFEQIALDISTFIEKIGIMHDLHIAKEHAEQSDRLKSAFLANMSHEIRTPMNGILGFAELLKEPDLTGEEQQEYIKIIEESGARMLNIINDIVDISKIESGLMEVSIKESNINEQIEYIYTFFRPEVEGKGMQLSYRNGLVSSESIIKTDRE